MFKNSIYKHYYGLLSPKKQLLGALAYHGHRVKMYDNNTETLNKAYSVIEEDKNMLRQEGLLLQKNFLGTIYYLSGLQETVKDADFIFEAIVDDLEMKQNLFQSASQMCKNDAVIATNSLKFHISDIAKKSSNKEQMIGLRFLYPVYYIPEVEITLSQQTSPETIEKGRKFLEKMGKTLFFRSGTEPLILKEEEKDMRKQLRLEQIKNSFGMTHLFKKTVPKLSHDGNEAPSQDEAEGIPYISSEQDCAICMANTRDCLLCPCHHMVTCYVCSSMLLNKQDGCPICRKDITEIVKVYHS
ncbi:probable 3-hydroxybutyryl-CoA dehydrogenase isoform X1 [Octopus bimaculoides]|nr:probable 3-hydroxybutyryl-CoA dehydrogenase isoform X1 [Octopus bimaculoides]|eukprot:XP_014787242.1 PREDICTED: probable 3-hydroxybutyryl-CoA dehydrogenase isoform X1 [Octopus bimaculoides]